jgi:hypothetical protein
MYLSTNLTPISPCLVHEKAEIYHPLFGGQITKAQAMMKLSEDGSSGGSRDVAWWAEVPEEEKVHDGRVQVFQLQLSRA